VLLGIFIEMKADGGAGILTAAAGYDRGVIKKTYG
jgi:hypothetical protein